MDDRLILLKLSQLGAIERFIDLTTDKLGVILETSQQSASLYLKRLESRGFIERIRKRNGSAVRITREGLEQLLGLYGQLKAIFDTSREIRVRGTITKGLGEGAYYLSQKRYKDQLKHYFDMEPFEGTLNIKLSIRDSPVLDLLKKGTGIKIEGFVSDGRSFGSCICYPCRINNVKGAIMIPNRTLHVGTLEVVSDKRLRDELGLKDGDQVEISITFPLEMEKDQ
ncbi:MAG: DUF120 domain-containing protein [Thermoplasmatota archaeon]